MSLESARSPDPAVDVSLVNFIAAHLTHDPVDLVAVFGEPATRFATRHRERLFPAVPLLIAGLEERRLVPEFVGQKTATVCDRSDPTLIIEDILRVLPKTREIVIIFGVSSLERFWSEASRRLKPYDSRVRFRWLEGLSFEAMKREVAALSEHSVVLFGLLLRDADGISFEDNHALIRLREVSTVPVFGFFESQMGVGVVGGRLHPDRSLGVKAAEVGARILRGEAPASIHTPPIAAGPPTFDSRELERWHIPLDRLPAGSSVLFRTPSFWQLYRWYLLGIVTVMGLETWLITVLLFQRLRRSRAERQLALSQRRMHVIADSLPVLIAQVDRDQRYVFMNRAYESWFGIDPESAPGRTIREVLGDDLYEVALPYVRRVLSGEQVTFTEFVTLPQGLERHA